MKDPAVKHEDHSIDYIIGFVEGLIEVAGNSKMSDALKKLLTMLKTMKENRKNEVRQRKPSEAL